MNKFNRSMEKLKFAVIIVVGIVFLAMGLQQKSNQTKKSIDILDSSFDFSTIEEGDHVKIDVDFIMYDAVVYTEDGKEKSRIYCLPHLTENDDGYFMDGFIGVRANSSEQYDVLDSIADDSRAWWNDETDSMPKPTDTYKVDGVVKKLNKEELKYFNEYVEKNCGSDKYAVPYVIVPNNGADNVAIILGAVLMVIGGAFLISTIVSDKKRMEAEMRHEEGYEDALM